jgi:hypothetical protein
MSFYIAQIINRLLAPRHELSCTWLLWLRLLRRLRERGRNATRESGAFLLGMKPETGPSRIVDFVLYDDLDPNSLDTGIIRFDGKHFGKLWALCRERGFTVVAEGLEPGRHEPMALAPMLAAALAINEAFLHVSGELPSAGRRTTGLDLWSLEPGDAWLSPAPDEPASTMLPSKLWLIGLGHLGQAYLWGLGLLPYAAPGKVSLVLQDNDVVTPTCAGTMPPRQPPNTARI